MRTSQRAFTLVELLVVIFIIGVLVALLLPAVQAAREAARKTTCRSNLRQIGIALNNYESAYSRLPPFLIGRQGNHGRIGDIDKGGNWLVALLPFVEEQALYDQWNFNVPANQNPARSTEVDLYQCPSDGNSVGNLCNYAGGGWARGNYGMNVSPCNFGVSGGRNSDGGIGAANYSVQLRQIADGTSKTVAVDELRAGLNPEDIRGSWAMPGLSAGTAALFGDAASPNDCGGNSDDMENCAATGLAGDGTQCMGCFESNNTGQMASRSAHPGGVHVMMVDGSVQFVVNDVDSMADDRGCGALPVGTWQAMHTRGIGDVIAK